MINELDTVALTRDVPQEELKRGDVGAVVHIYPNAEAYEVEFVSAEGKTVALLTLLPSDIRPVGVGPCEILHVRELVPA